VLLQPLDAIVGVTQSMNWPAVASWPRRAAQHIVVSRQRFPGDVNGDVAIVERLITTFLGAS